LEFLIATEIVHKSTENYGIKISELKVHSKVSSQYTESDSRLTPSQTADQIPLTDVCEIFSGGNSVPKRTSWALFTKTPSRQCRHNVCPRKNAHLLGNLAFSHAKVCL